MILDEILTALCPSPEGPKWFERILAVVGGLLLLGVLALVILDTVR